MKLSKLSERKWNYFAIAFAIPVVSIVVMMMIAGDVPFGKSSMLYSDMYHQYYPFFVSFRRALLSGQSLLYNWDVGMGMDYVGLVSYYLASPLNLLTVLIPEKWVLGYFSFLVPLKLGFASLFFAVMLNRLFEKYDFSICVFGAFYGLCAWALGYQWNVMWLDTFALLPLVALGTVRLLRDKKCILYTLTLFLSVYSNYYVGLFTCIFVLLLFVCYEICRGRSFGRLLADLFRIGLFSLLAIGMTAFLELPTLAALQNTQSSVNAFPKGFKLNIADENTWIGLLDAMRQVAGNTGGGHEVNFKEGLPNLYCGVGMVMLSFLFLLAGKVKLRDKICSVLLLLFFMISFIIRQLDYIWHGFHFTNMIPYRFSFLYSFVVLYMAYRAWLLRASFRTWQIIVAFVLSLGVFACSDQRFDPIFLAYNAGFLTLYLLCWIYRKTGTRKKKVRLPRDFAEQGQLEIISPVQENRSVLQCRRVSAILLVSITVLEIILNMVNFGVRFTGASVSDYPRGKEATASIIRYMKQREEDNPFYRAEVTHTQTLNDGALNNYRGISTFTSSANVRVTKFMKKLGYSAKNTYNRYCFETGSPVANLFLSLKYMIERDTAPVQNQYFNQVHYNDDVYLLENNAYLPLGFLTEPELADLDFTDNMNCVDFQNRMFNAATGNQEKVWTFLPRANIAISAENAVVNDQSSLGRCTYDECASDAAIIYNLTAHKDGLMCVNLDLSARNSYTVSLNGTELFHESISLPQLIAVSDVKAGDVVTIRIKRKNEDSGTIVILPAILDDQLFRQGYEKLAASPLEVTSFQNTRIEGTITCNRNGLMYTSVPQDGGWNVTVDGKPAEISLIGDVMIGVEMTEGVHQVEFIHKNKAFEVGGLISLGCAAVFAITVLILYRPRRKYGKFEKKA